MAKSFAAAPGAVGLGAGLPTLSYSGSDNAGPGHVNIAAATALAALAHSLRCN